MIFQIEASIDLLCTEHGIMHLIYTHNNKCITFIKLQDVQSLKTYIFNINEYQDSCPDLFMI